jgi:hypothetical protein
MGIMDGMIIIMHGEVVIIIIIHGQLIIIIHGELVIIMMIMDGKNKNFYINFQFLLIF